MKPQVGAPRSTFRESQTTVSNQRPSTIDDVARLSGYSVATVSRALRGLPNVAPATRARIEEAADRLQYQPDPAAIGLATGRSRAVVMALPNLSSWYFGQIMAGAEAVLSESGHDLLVFTLPPTADKRLESFRSPTVARAAGFIMVDLQFSSQEAMTLQATGLELVSIGTSIGGFGTVRIDDIGVAEMAVTHLTELGHRRIGLLAGQNDDPFHFDVPRERQLGYRSALIQAGIPLDQDLEQPGNFSVQGGADAMNTLLDLDDPPTAVFAMSDEMAFGAMQAARSRNLVVPDDLSLVGVDNHDLAPVVGLTTIDQSADEHGVLAAGLLIERLAGDSPDPVNLQAPIRLITRQSTAPPPS
ncbi:MAG: LacI family DNA-binding transcriptional regulator [Actinomycetota bacterium]